MFLLLGAGATLGFTRLMCHDFFRSWCPICVRDGLSGRWRWGPVLVEHRISSDISTPVVGFSTCVGSPTQR